MEIDSANFGSHTRSYSKRSRAPTATRRYTKISNRTKQSSNTSCGEPRALLRSPELEGKARRALQPTGVQSAEKPSQLESENLTFRDENQALDTASNKKRRFRAQIRPMPTLEMPNSGTGVNIPPTTSQGDIEKRKKTNGAQTYDVEDSESEPEPDKEEPEGAAKT